MKNDDVRKLSDDEVAQAILDTRQELFNLRLQQSTGQLENPARLRILRHDVARLLTVQHERATAQPRTST